MPIQLPGCGIGEQGSSWSSSEADTGQESADTWQHSWDDAGREGKAEEGQWVRSHAAPGLLGGLGGDLEHWILTWCRAILEETQLG